MGDGNSSSINNNMVDAYDGEGDNHTNHTTTNGFWTSQSHHHHHGLMMMMNSTSSYHPQNHDEPPLPPLPPSTAIFNGGPNNNSSVASTGYYFVNRTNHDAEDGGAASIKAKIMAHPHYPSLLSSYVNCQKVGAPPEAVKRLEEAVEVGRGRAAGGGGYLGEDPALDQFMEAYCEMLTKYEQELTKPFKEAMVFLSKIECQFKALSLSPLDVDPGCGEEADDRDGSPVKEIDMNANLVDPQAEDRELKCQLLRKYSGYLGNLKQEFMKKRKKGKLPKEARQQLLDWWTRHYKWPYPSESQKLALAEATGLDQKQINNWFINQRKRHWKPSEDMQFVVVDAAAHHHVHPHYYMENLLGNPYPLDVSPALL